MPIKNGGVIELIDVRLSFPQIWVAKSFEEGQPPRYEASFLLDPSNGKHEEMIKEIKQETKRVATEKWGNDWKKENFFKGKCFGTEAALATVYDGYADMFWVRTAKLASDGRPLIVDRDGSPLTVEDGKPYAGCNVSATLSLWCQDNKFGKRINANLRAIKFRSDNDAFSANAIGSAEDEFSDDDEDDVNTVSGDDADFLDD